MEDSKDEKAEGYVEGPSVVLTRHFCYDQTEAIGFGRMASLKYSVSF